MIKGKKSGITLIALIITIIVLLILAGVAISSLTGQGNIIENAENAVGKYNNSVTTEQQLLNEIEKYFTNYLDSNKNQDTTIDKTDISSNPNEFYGAYVTNYTTKNGDPNVGWRIFYADDNNIYLIADDYIHYEYAPQSLNYSLDKTTESDYCLAFDNVYKDYSNGAKDITDTRVKKWLGYINDNAETTNISISSVAFMLDTSIWDIYSNDEYSEYAVGGPTLELYSASYNETHKEKQIEYMYDEVGYWVKWNNGEEYSRNIFISDTLFNNLYMIDKADKKAESMWIASPSCYDPNYLMKVGTGLLKSELYDGSVDDEDLEEYGIRYINPGFRPIVCLKSETKLEKISDTEYRIIES